MNINFKYGDQDEQHNLIKNTMDNNTKQITPDAVREAAEALMSTNGSTTTLDVKQRLRQDGYWALQRDVSRIMDSLHASTNWTRSNTGAFFRYFPDDCPTAAPPTMATIDDAEVVKMLESIAPSPLDRVMPSVKDGAGIDIDLALMDVDELSRFEIAESIERVCGTQVDDVTVMSWRTPRDVAWTVKTLCS